MVRRAPRDRESPQAKAAFDAYVALGMDRSLTSLALALHKNRALLGRWSARHHWQDRISDHLLQQIKADASARMNATMARLLEQQRQLFREMGLADDAEAFR